jgi:hypothetical protein
MAQLQLAAAKGVREAVGRFLIGAPGRSGGIGRESASNSTNRYMLQKNN